MVDPDLFISIDARNGFVYAGFVSIESNGQKKNLVEYIKNSNHPNKIELLNAATIPLQTIKENMIKKNKEYEMIVKEEWAINNSGKSIYVEPKNIVHFLRESDIQKFNELCKD